MGEGIDTEKRQTLRQFAALGAISPLAHLVDGRTESTSEVRTAIIGYIASTPGAHFSKIRDDLALATGETQYHLKRLVSSGVIESSRDGDYRRYFPAGEFGPVEMTALGYLRRSTPRGIIIALLRSPSMNGAEIAEVLDVSSSTVSKYTNELIDVGILVREDGYSLVDPETLLILLVRYAHSFDDNAQLLAAQAPGLIDVSQ